ncbi:hypothetical protein FSP39_023855 [Pinctada imbricata]|uniref:Purple acid phosphatase n=1 Tax=Pinctada imbricata TaxID=66713 RepID=A0AA88XK29_PINIB|nr:hypothetical protein FSP39_023855 [Pinctada imbricata]
MLCFLKALVRGLDRPEQIHLSLGNSDDIMTVMWATSDDVTGHVMYGESMNNLGSRSNSSVATLQTDSWNAMKNIHRAQMNGLVSGSTYFYKVVSSSGEEKVESSTYSFTTISQNKTKPRKFLVYGDLGKVEGKPTFPVLKEEVDSGEYDVIWHVGDFAYNMESDGGKTGDDFLSEIEPIASRIPYMTAPGNHELGNQLHHYRTRFSMPGTTWPMSEDRLWYSYNIGLVHFISYSTEVYFIDNQDYVCQQYYWLLQDLITANQNRDKQPWIVAMGHRPMYCSNKDADDCSGRIFGYWVKHGLEDLFQGQGVDLVIQAHEHSYERLWPVYNEKIIAKNYVDPEALVHVTSGAAGCGEIVDKMGEPDPWSAFRADTKSFHSFGKLIVYNNTHLQFIQETVKPRAELDNFWIVQHNHGPRFDNVDCQNNSHANSICRCPFPFHYVTVAVASGITLVLVIVMACIWCCRRCGLCHCSRTTCSCCRKQSVWTKMRMKFEKSSRDKSYVHPIDCDTYNLLDNEDVEI